LQAKPERQTPINTGAYDSYNVMMEYVKNTKKYQNAYAKATTTSTQCATTSSPITLPTHCKIKIKTPQCNIIYYTVVFRQQSVS